MGLNDRQKQFLAALLKDPKRNATRAALVAGCTEKSAKVQGSRWAKLPEVQSALAGLKQLTGSPEKLTPKKLTERLTEQPEPLEVAPANNSLQQPLPPLPFCDANPLNDRQERFCREFVVCNNATQAYLRVYSASSHAAAMTDASRLLRNAKVLARIEQLKEERNKRLGISADRVLGIVAAQAFFDPRDLFDADGRYKPINELDPDTAAAVSAMGTKHQITGDEKDEVAVFVNVKFADRLKAAELLGKNLKLWTDKVDIANEYATIPTKDLRDEALRLAREIVERESKRDK